MVSYVQPTFIEYIVIDGQQRITSITLFLKALHDLIDDENIKEDIYESYIINKRASEPLRIKLKPIESDMVAYRDILANEYADKDNNIINNYNFFKSLIEESNVSPKNLYDALNNVEIVYIQLEKDKKSENPQLIFESLNSTGLSLTSGDLIRNFLLMNHSAAEQGRLYTDYWLKMETILNNSKISDFVRDYLTMKTNSIIAKSRVYENFKEFALNPKNNFDEEGLLEELLLFSKYYSWFLYYDSENSRINYYLEQFQQLKSTTIYPVLLYIFEDCFSYKKMTEDELIEILKIFISYIVRRQICNFQSNALNKIFTNLISEIEGNSEPIYIDKILSILSKKTSTGTFPKNEQFEISFIQKPLYNTKIDRYILQQLEHISSKEKIQLTNLISIEHIMPKKLTPQWQIELGKKFEEIHSEFLNTIGNLTLTAYNSELSNKIFNDKKEIYKNSNIGMCRDVVNYDIWDDTSIKKRAQILFEKALNIWPLPEKYNKQKENLEMIDSTTLYNILTDINVTGVKPKQLVILDTEYSISSWKDLLKQICCDLYSLGSSVFYNLIKHKDFTGRDKYIIDNTSDSLRAPFCIGEGIYIETNLSAIDILNYCKIIAVHYGMAEDIYFMLSKK